MIVQQGGDVRSRTRSSVSTRTLAAGLAALVIGAGGTVAVNRVLAGGTTAARTAQATYLPPVGRAAQPAPDFRLSDQSGQLVSLSALRGREVLVTFMDPQCTQLCPVMGQEISAVEAALPAKVDPVLLVVSVAANRTATDVGKFVANVAWRPGWHWLLGDQAQLQAVWATWQVNVVPTTSDVQHDETLFVVNPQGQIVDTYNAPLGIAEVASIITKHSTR